MQDSASEPPYPPQQPGVKTTKNKARQVIKIFCIPSQVNEKI